MIYGIYYFTMPENNRVLTYYMSDSPKGPWKYKGEIMAALKMPANAYAAK